MSRRIAIRVAILSCLVTGVVLAAGAGASSLNSLSNLFSRSQDGAMIVGVTGSQPIMDFTYYDYDPETFVVDMADVDVSKLPKTMEVNKGGVLSVKIESITRKHGQALAKLEIKKAYLAKCIVSTKGNELLVRVVGMGKDPAPETNKAVKAPPQASKEVTGKAVVSAKADVATAPSAKREASRLIGINVAPDGSSVGIKADGTPHFKYFTMKNPVRIVVDLYGVSKGRVPNRLKGAGEIEQVRVGILQAKPLVTRVVLDMKKSIKPLDVETEGSLLMVRFAEGSGTIEETHKKAAPEHVKTDKKAEVAEKTDSSKTAPAPAPAKVAETKSSEVAKSDIENVKVDLSPISPNGSKEFKGYHDLFVAGDTSTESAGGKTLVAGGVPLSFKEKTITGGGTKYTGQPISLSLKDADIKDVLRMFHDISKMNIVVHPAVRGKVTVDLNNVPWDQAMDIILKNNGLDYIYENNVIWVAPAAEIARKFAEQQRLQKQKLLAEEPVTFTKRLSYAKASDMRNIASKFLSDRGDIIVDKRTNTLIIREVPSKKAGLLKLINSLDTATPQVLIEARIVETNITWAQSFGITWSGNWYSGMTGNDVTTTYGGTNSSGPAGDYKVHNFNGNKKGWPNFGSGDFAVTVPPSASNGFVDLVLGNITGSFFLDVRLAAMENMGRGRVLSAPRIVTQDNQKASIESGRQIPIRIATTDKISVIFVNATLKLDVTPQISADGNINMTVDITNDSVDFANTTPGNPPPIIKKEAKTVLKVRDGQTAVIGGVFVTNEGVSQSGLPFLSKIPVLGWLFKNREKSRTNDELLIFLTPKIIR